jgi:hypothetical protein
VSSPGPLLPSDELLIHQFPSTFARVSQSDRAWTEKVWAMAAAVDGSLSIAFGLGKYTNRNVMDAFAGVSRGTEQWTVRGSRRLSPDPESSVVGPITYEIVEPLSKVRLALAENDIVPIAFDVVVEGVAPPVAEEQEVHTSRSRYRIDADVVRFHQTGVAASGWVSVDGDRVEVGPETWVGARDRSWGVRYAVGAPLDDVEPTPMPPGTAGLFLWMPVTMFSSGRRPYALHVYFQRYAGAGWSTGSAQGGIELASGRLLPFSSIDPDLRFDDANRRFLGGTIGCRMGDGEAKVFSLVPVSDTGFHLGTGLYGGWDGHFHGEFRGELVVEGEHVTGCDRPEVARRLHQHRDCIVRVEDPDTGDWGVGTLQSGAVGAHPAMGLTEANSFD